MSKFRYTLGALLVLSAGWWAALFLTVGWPALAVGGPGSFWPVMLWGWIGGIALVVVIALGYALMGEEIPVVGKR